jgi:hypothetical protein
VDPPCVRRNRPAAMLVGRVRFPVLRTAIAVCSF